MSPDWIYLALAVSWTVCAISMPQVGLKVVAGGVAAYDVLAVEACALARAARDRTGKATRVVKIVEAAMYPGRHNGGAA